jgi:uncharacterized lipoprotein YajG
MRLATWAVVAAALSISACTHFIVTRQAPILVRPELAVSPASIGTGKTLYVRVLDERLSDVLGERAPPPFAFNLTVVKDFTDGLRDSLSKALRAQGFSIASEPSPGGRELRVAVRQLDYSITIRSEHTVLTRLTEGYNLRVGCQLKAVCLGTQTSSSPVGPVEKSFSGGFDSKWVWSIPDNAANVKFVNGAISQALNALLADTELSACLASPH